MIHPKRSIRSFVHRDGRMTQGQKQALETLWESYGVDLFESEQFDLSTLFKKGVEYPQKLILEIGFGMGHSLLNMAEQFPKYHFLGVEIYRKGLGSVLNAVHAKQLKNVRVVSDDAVNVLQHIPAHILDAVLIFFPDPWPKKRHHKRRLIQPGFIELICQKLRSGGYLHIATDWKNYAEHIAEVLIQFPDLTDFCGENALIMPRASTKFEERGRKLGHEIYEFVRVFC